MSFILDALRKSESERQRQSGPGFADLPNDAKRARAPRWLWAIAALLAVNVVILAGLLLRAPQSPAQVVSHPAAADAATGTPAQSFSNIVAEARHAAPPPPEHRAGASRASDPVSERSGNELQHVAATPKAGVSPPASQVPESLPSFNDLRLAGELPLPELHLDIHVFSERPADRFVFINMTKYREHATMSEGPAVQEITQDGVILEYKGAEFLLPRE